MYQISTNIFHKLIEDIKLEQDFINFINAVSVEAKSFIAKPEFAYKVAGRKFKKHIIPSRPVTALDKKLKKHMSYLKDISKLMFMPPAELQDAISKLRSLEIDKKNPIEKGFGDKIQDILDYKTLRSGSTKLLHSFYKRLGIKVCIYCNSQHTIILNDGSKTMRLQADHNHAKTKFPAFSITLSNLYPTCNNCNHLKKEFDLEYKLYYESTSEKRHDLRFQVSLNSINDYCINRNSKGSDERINIEFIDYYKGIPAKSSKLNKVLKIDKIYENHKHVVAELINKKLVYNGACRRGLSESFKRLFPGTNGKVNDQLFNQMLYGHSLESSDINKRVFAKLTNDIQKQLEKYTYDSKKNELK